MTRVELEPLPDSAYASVRPSESSKYFSETGVCKDMTRKDGMLEFKDLSSLSVTIPRTQCVLVTGTPDPHSDILLRMLEGRMMQLLRPDSGLREISESVGSAFAVCI
jgi:hypothetical protein